MGYDVETSVIKRYAEGAKQPQPSLCCPTQYDDQYLKIIPDEIIAKDYGCGDPTRYVNPGEIVLDLGSGAGKNCYIIAQKVGENGQVIGVDFNDEMLNLARKYQDQIADQLGYHNVQFVKGKIQDLKLPLAKVEEYLSNHTISNLDQLREFEAEGAFWRENEPLIKNNSIDVVVSNCVLNLVKSDDKKQLFNEIYRVLKKGGRAVISDIVSDENIPPEMINDPDLWSGCLAGAFREDLFLKMFADAGFYGIEIIDRQESPWQVINGIEFRSLTVRAYKGKEGECKERNQGVIYKGPWRKVEDDDGHVFYRGEKMAVCDKTFHLLTNENSPYQNSIIPVSPLQEVTLENATDFNFQTSRRGQKKAVLRSPQETKGNYYIDNKPSCC